MNCSQHGTVESIRFCHWCQKYLCRSCIQSGHCSACGHLLTQRIRKVKLILRLLPLLFLVLWCGNLYYALLYRRSEIGHAIIELFCYNSIALTAAYIPFYLAIIHYSDKRADYMKYIVLGIAVLGAVTWFNESVIVWLSEVGARRE